jgi:hypothetical protein
MAAPHHPAVTAPAPSPDVEEARRDRSAGEARLLGEARVCAEKGRTVREEQIDAWVDSLGGRDELAPPRSGV